MTDVLAYIDQATYLSARASGRSQLAQFVWVYRDSADMAGLAAFHRNLGYGLAGRLIEPSPLPFGRHRWVAAQGPAAPLDVAPTRPPAALGDWIDERSQVPVDPVRGPGWHLGVLPMSDGSTAVTLVASHCLLDGGAALEVLVNAVTGVRRDFGYRQPRSRHRFAAWRSDLRQALRDAPELGRTIGTAARFAYARRDQISSSRLPRGAAFTGPDAPVVIPAVSAILDAQDWDKRAQELDGTGYSLLAGFAAVLGARLGRARPSDGQVTLLIAMSDRDGPDDRRGNAMKIGSAEVDPASAPVDLEPARGVIRAALQRLRDDTDEKHALLPITPIVPVRAVRRTAHVVFGDLPVSCSNLGEVRPEIACPDGRQAQYVMFRPVDQGVRRAALENAGGQLVVAAGRVAGTVSIGVVGYEVGAANDREWLTDNVIATLGEFELKGVII
jgi:hypothetical protein